MSDVRHQSWNDVRLEALTPLISHRLVAPETMMLVDVYLKQGAIVPAHDHVNEQLTQALSGITGKRLAGASVLWRLHRWPSWWPTRARYPRVFRARADRVNVTVVTWKFFEIRDGDTKAQVLLDHRFAEEPPSAAMPNIGWFGVWCNEEPKGAYWSPTEAPALDALEEDLITLAEKHGNGWAVYLRRYATPGLREYYFYFGEGADMGTVAAGLAGTHPGYRVEFEARPDPTWSGYASWLKDAPLG